MFKKIKALIEKYDVITLHGHINPDGDSFGSQIGLKEAILATYPHKKVYVAGSGCPKYFAFIGKPDDISDEVMSQSLAIVLDGNNLDRMEDKRIYSAKAFAKIDHHISLSPFNVGEEVVVNKCNSTCEIVVRMLREGRYTFNKNVANALFLGILTDTARFQFVNDFSTAFKDAVFLVKHGAEPRKLLEIINLVDESSLKIKGYILSNYQKTKNGVLYYVLNKEQIRKLGCSCNLASNLVNLLGSVDGSPIWASFCQYNDETVRMEIRSSGPSIFEVAKNIGGGGHLQAAGAQLPTLDLGKINEILNQLDKMAEEYKKGNK